MDDATVHLTSLVPPPPPSGAVSTLPPDVGTAPDGAVRPSRAATAGASRLRAPRVRRPDIYDEQTVYTAIVAKHLVDIDEMALASAQAELGTVSMKDTVNEALRRASVRRSARVQKALDRLGQRRIPPREEAWR